MLFFSDLIFALIKVPVSIRQIFDKERDMPKRVFWPATLVIMGMIFLASNLGLLPSSFWNFWPLILIIVGLGGLVISDREEWMVQRRSGGSTTARTTKTKSSGASKKSMSTSRSGKTAKKR